MRQQAWDSTSNLHNGLLLAAVSAHIDFWGINEMLIAATIDYCSF